MAARAVVVSEESSVSPDSVSFSVFPLWINKTESATES